MSNHTPGPYSVHPYSSNSWFTVPSGEGHRSFRSADIVVGSGSKIVGTFAARKYAEGDGGGWPEVGTLEEMRANAALFIAAERLLSLAKAYIEAFEAGTGTVYLIDQARAAIALAESDLS